jgi:hypothetical protein
LLYLGHVAVVNENLFSTSLPGKMKVKRKMFLNEPAPALVHIETRERGSLSEWKREKGGERRDKGGKCWSGVGCS